MPVTLDEHSCSNTQTCAHLMAEGQVYSEIWITSGKPNMCYYSHQDYFMAFDLKQATRPIGALKTQSSPDCMAVAQVIERVTYGTHRKVSGSIPVCSSLHAKFPWTRY